MRVNVDTVIPAGPEEVWRWVGNLETYPEFVSGLTRWEADGDHRSGLGARYRALMRIGSADVGGLVEVVELHEPFELAWNSVTGVEHRGRWRLRADAAGGTRVELRLIFHLAGWAPMAWLTGQIAARTIRVKLDETLAALRRLLVEAGR